MEIDPRLHSRREDSSSEGTDSAPDYPEPPSQSLPARRHPGNPYNTQSQPQEPQPQPAHAYQEESSSALRASPNPNDSYADLRRPRACEACRQLKVRCEPDLVNLDEPCKRCAKAGRSCVVTAPTRKRQKKTDGLAELERQVAVLTAEVSRQHKLDTLLPSTNSAQTSSSREENVGRRWLVSGQASATDHQPRVPSRSATTQSNQSGSKRNYSGEVKDSHGAGGVSLQAHVSHSISTASPSTERTADTPGRPWASPWSNQAPGARESVNKEPDIIDRGFVSPSVALDAFTRYVDAMAGHIPMVVFPVGTQMSDVRRTRPVLFHAIVAIAVGPFQADVQAPLLQELYKTIGERVLVKGEKSLDLVQALLLACSFYTPPENFEEIKFFQLAHMAVGVAMDIGMNRKSTSKHKPFNPVREAMKHPPSGDPDSPEARRAWLGCYFVSVQTSSALRRPILTKWLPYMDECIEILEYSQNALPSDKIMIHWARLGRIIEEISARFFADDAGGGPSFADSTFQFTLKTFEKQLQEWKREASKTSHSAIMSQAEAIVSIYLHENAMVLETPGNDKADKDISSLDAASRISALSTSLASIHQAVDTVCSIPPKELVNIPTVALARTAFAIVALIKLYSIVTAPDSYVGQVIEPGHLKVEYYLSKVIAHYTAAGELPGGVTPGKFSTVLTMLREWFRSRKGQQGSANDSFQATSQKGDAPNSEVLRMQHVHPNQVTTPLHLLSEVATDPKTRNPNQQQQQQQQYPTHRPSFPDPISQPQQPSPDIIVQSLPCSGISPTPGAPSQDANSGPTPWPSFQPQVQQIQHQHQQQTASGPGPFYAPPFESTPPTTSSPNQNPALNPTTQAQQSAPVMGYPDFSTGDVGFFVPELGAQMGFSDPGDLSAIWNTLGADMGVFYPQQGGWPY